MKGFLPAYYDFYVDKIVLDEDFDENAFKTQIKEMLLSDDTNQQNLAVFSLMVLKEVNKLNTEIMQNIFSNIDNPQ
ncbi:MAG: hypothetical protein C0190_06000 [Thermodesulfobacterium geofontis]|uniref:Uncharacterized protein n=1 Tax=Thermodesulfobacterium geofontis TaxID=1295609 RepID=A0A2N7PMC0_9BACT|nr:MAG: hypothetical protein C0190_06000 [Thermodesulfobacterium geofontis]